MNVVTRFPPSPTGFMHIGNARTALYNWLYARHYKGEFLLRIEDTDRERHSEEAVEAIIDGLDWLELDYDNEPVSQYEQKERHIAIAHKLLEENKAYYCYCSKEELQDMREQAIKSGKSQFYDRRWRDRSPEDAPSDINPVVRIKAPIDDGESSIDDLVQGHVSVSHENLDDFILLRSDGSPTYMLSVVCDDHEMGITHVIRGDDHLNNTFRQKIIYEAMGWSLPYFAHLPMILGHDGSKLSKRHGAISLEDFQERGYLPEAVANYLLRLGWSHGDDEIISREDAIKWFTLDNVTKSPAKFDYDKLESLNSHYLKLADNDKLISLLEPIFKTHFQCEINHKRLSEAMDELKDRATTLIQIAEESAFFCMNAPIDYNEKASQILQDTPTELLDILKNKLSELDKFSPENVQLVCKEIAQEHLEKKMGKIAMPLRAAIAGTTITPSVFNAAVILGKEEVILRISDAINKFGSNTLTKANVN